MKRLREYDDDYYHTITCGKCTWATGSLEGVLPTCPYFDQKYFAPARVKWSSCQEDWHVDMITRMDVSPCLHCITEDTILAGDTFADFMRYWAGAVDDIDHLGQIEWLFIERDGARPYDRDVWIGLSCWATTAPMGTTTTPSVVPLPVLHPSLVAFMEMASYRWAGYVLGHWGF